MWKKEQKKKEKKIIDSNNNDWFNCIQACMFLIYDMNGNNKILFICYTYFYTNIYICITHKSNIIYLYFKEMKEKGRRNRMIYLSNRMKPINEEKIKPTNQPTNNNHNRQTK